MHIIGHHAGQGWAVSLLLEPRDLWVGVYWTHQWEGPSHMATVYICVLPMLPIRVTWTVRSLISEV